MSGGRGLLTGHQDGKDGVGNEERGCEGEYADTLSVDHECGRNAEHDDAEDDLHMKTDLHQNPITSDIQRVRGRTLCLPCFQTTFTNMSGVVSTNNLQGWCTCV
jgi:hypothetical protein